MTDIGELVVRIKADAAQLEREMRKAQNTVQQSAGGMSSAMKSLKAELATLVPAISAAAIVAFGKHAVDAAGHVTDLADQIGFAASTLAFLETPLAATGASIDSFAASINLMNNTIGEARKGSQEAVKAFDAIGLSVTKLKQLSPEQQFYQIVAALAQLRTQAEQTEAGRAIFGRGFSSLIPIIKETNGNLQEFIDKQKDAADKMSESLKRVDQFGDALSAAGIKAKNSFIEALAVLLRIIDRINEIQGTSLQGAYTLAKVGLAPTGEAYGPAMPKGTVSFTRPDTVSVATFLNAKGGNKDIVSPEQADKTKAAKEALAQFNLELQREHEFASMSPEDAAAKKAYYDTLEKAQKAGIKDAEDMALANEDVVRSTERIRQAQQEAIRFQTELHDKLTSSLTDIAFSFDSAADAARDFAIAIAKAMFERQIATPLADSLIGPAGSTGGGLLGGLGSFFGGFFADGGSPPVGRPSIVGENGPELFVPNSAGTVIPNRAMGGQTVVINNTWQVQSGVSRDEISNLIPYIEARTQASVFAAMRKGGPESQIAGLRS